MLSLTLVILAAGTGSRFGGPKQWAAVGPEGESLLEYTIADAMAAGFERVLFVIRREDKPTFRERVLKRLLHHVPIDYTFQEGPNLAERTDETAQAFMPGGSAAALLCVRPLLEQQAFGVVRADTWYGRASLERLAEYLKRVHVYWPPHFSLLSFPVEAASGARPLAPSVRCELDDEGDLKRLDVEEDTEGPVQLSAHAYGFSPAIFDFLEEQLRELTEAQEEGQVRDEFTLASALSKMILRRQARIELLSVSQPALSIIRPEDVEPMQAHLQACLARGEYGAPLWPARDPAAITALAARRASAGS